MVSQNNLPQLEVKKRIQAANNADFGLLHHFRSRDLPRKTKMGLNKTLIRPILLYALESWETTKSIEQDFHVFERKDLHQILGELQVGDAQISSCSAYIMSLMLVPFYKLNRLRWVGQFLVKDSEKD